MNHRLVGVAGLGTAVLVAALVGGSAGTAHQAATPDATPPSVSCILTPRSDADLALLSERAATPSAASTAPSVGDDDLEAGAPLEDTTRAGIETTLARIAACGVARDLPRLFALYTDDYIVRAVLPAEPVGIVPGTPTALPSSGTPEAAPSVWSVVDAVTLPDGRVVATVDRSGRLERVVFVRDGDTWLVDDVIRLMVENATPAANVPDDVLAFPAVQAAITAAAESADVSPSDVAVISVEPTLWSDSSLGCPQPDQFYAQVETPGYVITLRVEGPDVTYHTDENDAAVPCELGG